MHENQSIIYARMGTSAKMSPDGEPQWWNKLKNHTENHVEFWCRKIKKSLDRSCPEGRFLPRPWAQESNPGEQPRRATEGAIIQESYPREQRRRATQEKHPRGPRFEVGYVCQLWARGDVCQQIAKHSISIDNLYQNYIKTRYVCQFLGPHYDGKRTLLRKNTHDFFFFNTHDFGIPGPLWTPFKLKI